METYSSCTLGTLMNALIVAKTLARDFYITMLESFFYMPGIAHVWRSLMFDTCRDLHRLGEIQRELDHAVSEQPVDPLSVERANSVSLVLSEERIRAIKTLEDAFILLSEYEFTDVQAVVLTVTAPFYPDRDDGLPTVQGDPLGAQDRIASVRERLGPLSTFPLIQALGCSAFPFAPARQRPAA